jgi:hypothetical protein
VSETTAVIIITACVIVFVCFGAEGEKVAAGLTRMMHYAELLLGFYRRSDIHEAKREKERDEDYV